MTTTSPSPNPSTSSHPMPPESPFSSIIAKDEKEKTIPFLRQLTEMLQNNEELISFVPGQRLPHEIIHGKIIVHDRNRVQSEVLPVYFNHASFASLRRQLSYFSFVRVGKSRQSGVTYTNDSVVDLSDILKLKRRTSGGQAGGAVKRQAQRKRQNKQASPPPTPPLPPKEEQQQDEEHLATTASADDVASAVLSGTLHAAKTNDNLDINNSINSNSNGADILFSRVASSTHTSSAATQSSISQSNSSTESSDTAPNEDGGRRDDAAGPKPPKGRAKRRGSSLISKHHPLPRKDRARFDRLLSINNIVPFIHLPAGHVLGGGSLVGGETTVVASVARGRGDIVRVGGDQAVAEKKNAPKYLRERATSHGAIDALLALGAMDRQ